MYEAALVVVLIHAIQSLHLTGEVDHGSLNMQGANFHLGRVHAQDAAHGRRADATRVLVNIILLSIIFVRWDEQVLNVVNYIIIVSIFRNLLL